jgi:UDP-glucose:(heptosyl)LPS alpha-1,3-glucosyltransferase
MSPARRCGVVVFRRTGDVDEIDAIDEYSRRLVGAMATIGVRASYEPGGLGPVLTAAEAPPWVLIQYNPFRYGRWGFAPRLVCDALRLRGRGVPLAVMVHEAWVGMTDWRSTVIGLWQRVQLRALVRLADGVMTSTEALAREIGHGAVHVPISTNITPVDTSQKAARERLGLDGKLAVALFGRGHESRALDHAEAAIAAVADAYGANRLAVLNLGADAPTVRAPAGVEVSSPGRQTADELSVGVSASDVILLPLTDGISTRRTTLMAALAHGRPVLGLHGRNTDTLLAETPGALALTPVGDRAAFARAAVELVGDQAQLDAIGEAGRRLYEEQFDWPVLARRVASMLEPLMVGTPEIVFVANDVGESGGMERQSAQLVRRLLDAGHRVTVIARTCELPAHEQLRFVRVPTPRRPATMAYPAFIAVASLLAARRRRGALLHTTGAIVLGRADLSTVHYSHRAARAHIEGSRASRETLLYRINAGIAGVLSRAGEAWCYRPSRTRVLCAVSGGVATELQQGFPAMAGAIRIVPNGVEVAVFRPDTTARREVRAELGIGDEVGLALFVGGDWERKGLRYAVDALTLAPDWHLAVAGAGDQEPLLARARAAGTESRLRFLGPVRQMPRLYAAGDALVLPTAYETFSLVTFEAAASGLPLLVSRVSGVEDLLQDGRNGWFIGRAGPDIARRLNELRSDPELARTMAEQARVAASGYSWEAMAAGYVSIYSELIEDGR